MMSEMSSYQFPPGLSNLLEMCDMSERYPINSLSLIHSSINLVEAHQDEHPGEGELAHTLLIMRLFERWMSHPDSRQHGFSNSALVIAMRDKCQETMPLLTTDDGESRTLSEILPALQERIEARLEWYELEANEELVWGDDDEPWNNDEGYSSDE